MKVAISIYAAARFYVYGLFESNESPSNEGDTDTLKGTYFMHRVMMIIPPPPAPMHSYGLTLSLPGMLRLLRVT